MWGGAKWCKMRCMGENKYVGQLRSAGHKMTRYREALLDMFENEPYPISVLDILDYLSARGMEPNKTTVYRELDFLMKEGLIIEVEFGDGRKRYERADLPHHHHLICKNCKRVEDVEVDVDVRSVEKRIARQHGFKDVEHVIEFFGLCRGCSNS